MPARTKPRRYNADDYTHSVSKRWEDIEWKDGTTGPGLVCMNKCGPYDETVYKYLLDTRVKDFYVCVVCYRNLKRNEDWKCWGSGY